MNEIKAMRQLFYQAHAATSFSPEVRADSCVNDFCNELAADLEELGENSGNYKAKYLEHLKTWASRKSRTMSAMITGPARFPVERNRKAMDAEMRAWEEFRKWRERYIKRAGAERTKTPEEEIDDAIKRLEKERAAHSLMLEVNKIMRKKISIEEKKELMRTELELKDKTIENLFTPDYSGRIGFAGYELTNSNARIKNLEQKLLTMKARIESRDSFEPLAFTGGKITVEADRVCIWHDEKPDRATIESLKSRGFRWAPSVGCWCRKHTARAVFDARAVCNI